MSILRKGEIRKNLTILLILVKEGFKVSKQELSCKINIYRKVSLRVLYLYALECNFVALSGMFL